MTKRILVGVQRPQGTALIACHLLEPEVGINNIISKAQRNKAQRSFQPVKAQRKMRNLIFCFLKRSATSAMNFLIQSKRNAIPQLRNGIFVPS